jgi:hypothetical protein
MTILLIVIELGKFILVAGGPRLTARTMPLPAEAADGWSNLYHNYNRLPVPLRGLLSE